MSDQKTIFVTGASSGIGKATVEYFAANGWRVAATMRTPEKHSSLAQSDGSVRLFRLDVTNSASVAAAVEQAVAAFGNIDVLVNNAGYGLVGPFEAMQEAQIRRQLDTNLIGLMNVTRAVLPHFRANRAGTIINVASVGGRLTFPLYSVYHATKWAVEGFSEALTYELAGHGIRVKIIEPGPIKTEFYNRSMDIAKKPGLAAYDALVARVFPRMQLAGASAPGPEIVAESIWRAATDGSSRLRYKPNGAALLALRRLVPDRVYRALISRQLGV